MSDRLNRMDRILEAMAHGDSPIELRMQKDTQAHAQMLAIIKAEALNRLNGDGRRPIEGHRLHQVLTCIKNCGGE